MKPIFSRDGHVVGWLQGVSVYGTDGTHLAFLQCSNVYRQDGYHLGVFHNGWFRDHYGGAVSFISGATGGPLTPITTLPPIPPIPQLAPTRPVFSVAPVPGVSTLSWGINWPSFIDGNDSLDFNGFHP